MIWCYTIIVTRLSHSANIVVTLSANTVVTLSANTVATLCGNIIVTPDNSQGGEIIPTQTFLNLDKDKQARIVHCALDEFAERDFEHANLSNIVKNAQISRGSLYQYFTDKIDLYLHVMDWAKDTKMAYIEKHMDNPLNLPFVELFRQMYLAGIQFAVENPKMVKMMGYLLATKGKIYDIVFEDNIDIAIDLYIKLIDRDKEQGRIRKTVDSLTLAKMVIDMTINVSFEEMDYGTNKFDYDKMLERITLIMDIFKNGVITGEQGV